MLNNLLENEKNSLTIKNIKKQIDKKIWNDEFRLDLEITPSQDSLSSDHSSKEYNMQLKKTKRRASIMEYVNTPVSFEVGKLSINSNFKKMLIGEKARITDGKTTCQPKVVGYYKSIGF